MGTSVWILGQGGTTRDVSAVERHRRLSETLETDFGRDEKGHQSANFDLRIWDDWTFVEPHALASRRRLSSLVAMKEKFSVLYQLNVEKGELTGE